MSNMMLVFLGAYVTLLAVGFAWLVKEIITAPAIEDKPPRKRPEQGEDAI